jgi:hypothetical protein
MDIYRENSMDSLFNDHQKRIDSLILANYRRNTDFSVFTAIEQNPYVSPYVVDSLKSYLEISKRDAITRLSSNLDYEEIKAFQSQYPTLLSTDVEHLKDMAQSNMKTSAIRSSLKGDTQPLIDYQDAFGASDQTINRLLERTLFKAFYLSKNEEAASRYLLYFPSSDRAVIVKKFMASFTEQEKMEDLARQVLLNKYNVSEPAVQ